MYLKSSIKINLLKTLKAFKYTKLGAYSSKFQTNKKG